MSHEIKKLNALLTINETLEKILATLNEIKDMSEIVDELKELNSKKNIQMSVLHDYNISVESEVDDLLVTRRVEQQPSKSLLRPPTPRPPIEQELQFLTADDLDCVDVQDENIISE